MADINCKIVLIHVLVLLIILISWTKAADCPGESTMGQPCGDGKPCAKGISCLEGGTCGCESNQMFSSEKCGCKTKAGGTGCMQTKDCMEGSYCYHPRWKSFKDRKPAICKCCQGAPEEGVGGLCPGAFCASGTHW